MSVNLLTSYAKQLDNKLTLESLTRGHAKGEVRIIDVKAGVVEVLTPLSQELKDYNKESKTDRYGGIEEMQDSKQTYVVAHDKSFKIGLDKGNKEGQANLKQAGKMLNVQIKEQVTPAMDRVYFAKAAAAAAATGNTVIFDQANTYDNILDLGIYQDEATAPQTGRVLFVTPRVYKQIKKEIVTTVNAGTTNDKLLSKGFVGELDNSKVIRVPSEYFPANVVAIAVWEGALASAPIIDEARVKTDSENISGDLLIGRNKFDTFVLDAKKDTIATLVTA